MFAVRWKDDNTVGTEYLCGGDDGLRKDFVSGMYGHLFLC